LAHANLSAAGAVAAADAAAGAAAAAPFAPAAGAAAGAAAAPAAGPAAAPFAIAAGWREKYLNRFGAVVPNTAALPRLSTWSSQRRIKLHTSCMVGMPCSI